MVQRGETLDTEQCPQMHAFIQHMLEGGHPNQTSQCTWKRREGMASNREARTVRKLMVARVAP